MMVSNIPWNIYCLGCFFGKTCEIISQINFRRAKAETPCQNEYERNLNAFSLFSR